jgi:hypothetical protein
VGAPAPALAGLEASESTSPLIYSGQSLALAAVVTPPLVPTVVQVHSSSIRDAHIPSPSTLVPHRVEAPTNGWVPRLLGQVDLLGHINGQPRYNV